MVSMMVHISNIRVISHRIPYRAILISIFQVIKLLSVPLGVDTISPPCHLCFLL
jgi:hypothetical protein